jgi:hypothetical protein
VAWALNLKSKDYRLKQTKKAGPFLTLPIKITLLPRHQDLIGFDTTYRV